MGVTKKDLPMILSAGNGPQAREFEAVAGVVARMTMQEAIFPFTAIHPELHQFVRINRFRVWKTTARG